MSDWNNGFFSTVMNCAYTLYTTTTQYTHDIPIDFSSSFTLFHLIALIAQIELDFEALYLLAWQILTQQSWNVVQLAIAIRSVSINWNYCPERIIKLAKNDLFMLSSEISIEILDISIEYFLSIPTVKNISKKTRLYSHLTRFSM